MNDLQQVRFQDGVDSLGSSCAVVLSDFETRFGAEFLDVVDKLFAYWGSTPREVVCSVESGKSQGKYMRVRRRVGELLDFALRTNSARVAIEIGDRTPRDPQSFHNGSVATSLRCGAWSRDVWFALDEPLVASRASEFIELVASTLLKLTGPSYGYVLNYPKQYGVGYYVASVVSVPSGRRLSDFNLYAERITRWRDRKRLAGLRESDGYIREVYPVNFLLDSHLEAPVHGKRLRAVAEEFGSLCRFANCKGVHVWTVSETKITHAQDFLEGSGIVLSSPTEPILLPRRTLTADK